MSAPEIREPERRTIRGNRRGDVRVWLLALVLAVGVPLLTVQGILLFAIHADARAREKDALDAQARLLALRLGDFAQELDLVLAIARTVIKPEPRYAYQNDTALARIAVTLPAYVTSLSLYTPDGRNIGHSVMFANDSARRALFVTDRRYFQRALASRQLALGDAVIGRLTREWTVGAGRVERDAAGRPLYVQATTTVLQRIRDMLVLPTMPQGVKVRLYDTAGVVVAATDIDADSAMLAVRDDPTETDSVIVGRAKVDGAPWHVVVIAPTSLALGPVWQQLRQFIATAVVLIILAGILALALARRIALPLLKLGETAKAMTIAPYSPAPVSVTGPRVVRDLAASFNEMATLVGERTAALEQRERQYRLVTDGVPVLIGYIDASHTIRFLNRRAETFIGRPLSEVMGLPFEKVLGVTSGTPIAEALMTALNGHPAEVESQLARADETIVEVACSCVPHVRETGGIEGAFIIIADVSTSRRLESQLRQAQKMDAIGRLAGGIAHDFNNLLTVILANLEFSIEAARDLPAAQGLAGDLRTARESAERAAALTRQLLTYSRHSAGARETVDFNALAGSAERMMERLIGEQITMLLNLAPELWRVHADRSQLEQVLVNLVVNARDAMPAGGHLTIETSNVELDDDYVASHANVHAGEYVCLEVTDTGTGIAADVLPHIFEPFFTTKDVGEGTGLGLAVCYGIVQQHGGVISAYSLPGKGTTFKVLLPRSTELASGPSLSPNIDPVGGHEVILLVEDDEAVRRTARRALEEKGYRLLVAEDGQEALKLMAAPHERVDLLVSDFVMPGLSGVELANELLQRFPGLKVLLVSGYARTGARRAVGIPEGTPYLAKPYTARTLAAKVREVLDGA